MPQVIIRLPRLKSWSGEPALRKTIAALTLDNQILSEVPKGNL